MEKTPQNLNCISREQGTCHPDSLLSILLSKFATELCLSRSTKAVYYKAFMSYGRRCSFVGDAEVPFEIDQKLLSSCKDTTHSLWDEEVFVGWDIVRACSCRIDGFEKLNIVSLVLYDHRATKSYMIETVLVIDQPQMCFLEKPISHLEIVGSPDYSVVVTRGHSRSSGIIFQEHFLQFFHCFAAVHQQLGNILPEAIDQIFVR